MMRTVYRCPFADREACPRVEKFAEDSPIFQWSGCSIGPLAMKTGECLQTLCSLVIDPAVIQTPEDLAGCHLSDLVILPPKEAHDIIERSFINDDAEF